MKKFTLPLILLVCSASAFATTDRFNYSVDALATPETIQNLHKEVELYARKYCNERSDTLKSFQNCFKGVEQEIVEKIDDSGLTAYTVNGTHARVVAGI